jgi:hypothetical protein
MAGAAASRTDSGLADPLRCCVIQCTMLPEYVPDLSTCSDSGLFSFYRPF